MKTENKNKKYLANVSGFGNPQQYFRSLRTAKSWLKKQQTDTRMYISLKGREVLAAGSIHLRERPAYMNGFSAGKAVWVQV